MTKEEMLWAKQHDWFVRSVLRHDGTYAVIVRDEFEAFEFSVFDNFQLLNAWAGY